jgi:hypothetical protein
MDGLLLHFQSMPLIRIGSFGEFAKTGRDLMLGLFGFVCNRLVLS